MSRTQLVHSMACECIQVCARSNVERLVEELPSDMRGGDLPASGPAKSQICRCRC